MPRLGSLSSSIFFTSPQTPFKLITTLNNPNPYTAAQEDAFGVSVANNGAYTIVGSKEGDAAADFGGQNGKLYVYSNTGTALYTIDNPGLTDPQDNGDLFGQAVACSQSYIIAGARQDDLSVSVVDTGRAFIFDITDGTLLFTLNNPNPATTAVSANGDWFGSSVAISENYAAVAAPREDATGAGDDAGWIYIFDTSNGSLLHSIENPNIDTVAEYPGDQLGERVQTLAMNNTYTVVGSWRENTFGPTGGGDSGAIHIITNATGAVQTIVNPNPNGPDVGTDNFDQFGYSVDISNSYIIVGAIGEDTSGTNSGNAYIYTLQTGNWALATTLVNPNAYNTVNNDYFGAEVAITETYCAVAALEEDTVAGASSGVVYIFNPSNGALLNTIQNPNAYGTVDLDKFGETMSASNKFLTVGVPAEDELGNDNSGKVYIFKV
tara:strand:- start:475 stop:1782 length:1308 start_codon:yes stop_codon:yes gene_type:complete